MVKSSKSVEHQPQSDQELDAKAQTSASLAVIGETSKRIHQKIWTMKKWLSERKVTNPDGSQKTVMDPIDFSRFLESHITKTGKKHVHGGNRERGQPPLLAHSMGKMAHPTWHGRETR